MLLFHIMYIPGKQDVKITGHSIIKQLDRHSLKKNHKGLHE